MTKGMLSAAGEEFGEGEGGVTGALAGHFAAGKAVGDHNRIAAFADGGEKTHFTEFPRNVVTLFAESVIAGHAATAGVQRLTGNAARLQQRFFGLNIEDGAVVTMHMQQSAAAQMLRL